MANEYGPFHEAVKVVTFNPDSPTQVRQVSGSGSPQWVAVTAGTFSECATTPSQSGTTGWYYADLPAGLSADRTYPLGIYASTATAFSDGASEAQWSPETVATTSTGVGPYPIDHDGGTGLAAAAATLDLAGGTTFAAWATDALQVTSDGSTGVSGIQIRAYGKAAYDAATGSGLAGTTVTESDGRWGNAPLNLASGDYYVVIDSPGDGYASKRVTIRIP